MNFACWANHWYYYPKPYSCTNTAEHSEGAGGGGGVALPINWEPTTNCLPTCSSYSVNKGEAVVPQAAQHCHSTAVRFRVIQYTPPV